jgi:hypothetical protein
MRLNSSLKTREPNGRSTSNGERRLGGRRERRLAVVELLVTRTRSLVTVDEAENCRRRTLLEDNPTSG